MQLPSPVNQCAFKKCDKVHILCLPFPAHLLVPQSPLKEVILRVFRKNRETWSSLPLHSDNMITEKISLECKETSLVFSRPF